MALTIRFFQGFQSHEKNPKDDDSGEYKDTGTDAVIQNTARQESDDARSTAQTAGIALDGPLKFFIDGLRDQRKQAWPHDAISDGQQQSAPVVVADPASIVR